MLKVSDILNLKEASQHKGLYTISPSQTLKDVFAILSDQDIGSLVVVEFDELVGMVSFRELIKETHSAMGYGCAAGSQTVRSFMDDAPTTCTPATSIDEVRRMMLDHHVRYMPVVDAKRLCGVISFYDLARAEIAEQEQENKLLKAYIRDWPEAS